MFGEEELMEVSFVFVFGISLVMFSAEVLFGVVSLVFLGGFV